MIAEKESSYQVEVLNSQNRLLGIDTYSIRASTNLKELVSQAKALQREIDNIYKSLEFHRNRENVTNHCLETIYRMDTNFRHQSALLHQIDKRIYEINPIAYAEYLKQKEDRFSFQAIFYKVAKSKLPNFLFSWLEEKAKEQFSITH